MLVKYPTLKVYVMHAGGFFRENALMLMTMYPHIYVDIGALSWTPIAGDLLEPFLNEAKRRRMLDRVMFGSDQMRWPEAIGLAIDRVNRLDFLTVEEKAHIFYDDAAKFLGLPAEDNRAASFGREAVDQPGSADLPPFKDFKTSFRHMRATCAGGEVTPIHPFVLAAHSRGHRSDLE